MRPVFVPLFRLFGALRDETAREPVEGRAQPREIHRKSARAHQSSNIPVSNHFTVTRTHFTFHRPVRRNVRIGDQDARVPLHISMSRSVHQRITTTHLHEVRSGALEAAPRLRPHGCLVSTWYLQSWPKSAPSTRASSAMRTNMPFSICSEGRAHAERKHGWGGWGSVSRGCRPAPSSTRAGEGVYGAHRACGV